VQHGQLQIRPYREDDLTDVVNLWEAVFPDDPPRNDPKTVVARKLKVQRDLFLVGHLEGRLVATVMAGFDGYRGWIYHLAVADDLRRTGFGRWMMQVAEDKLRDLGCPKVNLQVRSSNKAVIDFYKKLGYRIEERASMGKQLD
jgi:ribosomal protein S18 acetylase RimI-like enzyme